MDPLAEEWKEKGNKCMKGEKFLEAMMHYTQALKIDPDNPTYYSNRSLAFLKVQQYYFALKDAEEVITRMPKWTKGHFRKAEVQMATEHYEEAVKSYKKALESDPDSKSLQASLAKATVLGKTQAKKEKRLSWLGALFGILVSILLVVADESLTDGNPIMKTDIIRFAVVTFVTMICYGFGVFYKHFLQSQRCSLFEPPPDLFSDAGAGNSASAKQVPQESQSKPSDTSKVGGAKQRKKGNS